MADLIISQPMTFTVDVKNGLVERPQRESLMRGDKMANRIIAELVYGSEPFDITGVTVKGKFCRPPNGDEIDLAGEAKGNVAMVQLTDQCYTSGGHYEARVILVLGGVERTVLFISGDVLKSGSGNAAGDEETGGSGGSTGSGLPAGGTAGQVLVKVSSAQGDAIWKTLTAADVGALPSNGTAVNATQLNGKDAKYYIQPRNLLDNSWWKVQKEIVNQRGQTEYTSNGYTIDRWEIYDGAVGVTSLGYITTSGQMYQKIDIPTDKVYTFAVENDAGIAVVTGIPANGIHSATLGNALIKLATISGYVEVVIEPAEGFDLAGAYWAALYEGEYTADNLPPYIPKGYAAELAECQRYFLKLSGGGIIGVAHAYESDGAYAFVPTPAVMRKAPSIAYESMSIGTSGYADNFANVTGWSNNAFTGNGVRFFVTSSNLTSGEIYCLTANNLTFDADL